MRRKIAVLMTCHNRCGVTLECLRRLYAQDCLVEVDFEVYLVDAGSTDGTPQAITKKFPEVHLIARGDDLFWCDGMRVAYDEASCGQCDDYLWLNDDAMLYPDALATMLKTAQYIRSEQSQEGIVVGSFCDPQTGLHTYGGVVQLNPRRPIKLTPLVPAGRIEQCDTMNGNCVLLSRKAAALVGNFSPEFSHWMGDIDYGLRAKAAGLSNWITDGYIGTCGRNEVPGWLDPNVPLSRRWKLLHSPKGMPPREWMIFVRRHVGISWPLYLASLYLRVLFPKMRKPDLKA